MTDPSIESALNADVIRQTVEALTQLGDALRRVSQELRRRRGFHPGTWRYDRRYHSRGIAMRRRAGGKRA